MARAPLPPALVLLGAALGAGFLACGEARAAGLLDGLAGPTPLDAQTATPTPGARALLASLRWLEWGTAGAVWRLALVALLVGGGRAFLGACRAAGLSQRAALAGLATGALTLAALPEDLFAAGGARAAALSCALIVSWAWITYRDEIAGAFVALLACFDPLAALAALFFAAAKGSVRVVAWGVGGAGMLGGVLPALVLGGAETLRGWGMIARDVLAAGPLAPGLAVALGVLASAATRPLGDEPRRRPGPLLEVGAYVSIAAIALPGTYAEGRLLLAPAFAALAAFGLERGRPLLLASAGLGTALTGAAPLLAARTAPVPGEVSPLSHIAMGLGVAASLACALLALLERRAARRALESAAPTDLEISVFFPAYNEGENIRAVVERALDALRQCAKRHEVIIVDDCSKDATPEVAKALEAAHPDVVRHVRHEKNRGYGGAVKTGLASARYAWVFFSDGDGQFNLAELPDFVRPLGAGAGGVIGYRRKRRDPFLRLVNAYCWGALVRTLFGIGARDIDCAFKILPTKVIQRLDLLAEGALISTEILAKLERAGVKLVERPVTHLPRERGTPTGANPRVILRAFVELFRFRKRLAGFRLPAEAS